MTDETKPRAKMNPSEAGRAGGLVGGKARAASMTPERRKEIAQLSANARWAKWRLANGLPENYSVAKAAKWRAKNGVPAKDNA